MSSSLRTRWQRLRAGTPGRRFQDRYQASRRSDRKGLWLRIGRFVLAGAAIAVGFVLVFIPGPAILFFAIAGTLLASESRGVARFLDGSEIRIRRIIRWSLRRWRRLSWPGRVGVSLVIAASVAAVGFAAYRVALG